MTLDSLATPSALISRRFFLVDYLPTYTGFMFIVILVWSGAPGHHPSFTRAWNTAAHLGVAQLVLLSLAVVLLTVLLGPFQLALVRIFEGAWPERLGRAAAVRRQTRRRQEAEKRGLVQPAGAALPPDEESQRAGVAEAVWRERYPAAGHMIRATAFGNILAAMEENAGRRYGHDPAVTWPRIYLVLDERTRAAVDQRRNAMDASIRLTATSALAAVIAACVLLSHGGTWLLLAFVPLAVAAAGYFGAIQGALAYAQAVHVAYDLCRFDLLSALHLPLPPDLAAERLLNGALSGNWRQNIPLPTEGTTYSHPSTDLNL